MAAYIMALFTGLGGNREFFVRIGGLLSSLLVIGLIYLSCRRLSPEDRDIPWEVTFVANITLLFAAGCIIQTPDTPLLLFWTLAVYCGIRILTGGSASWWYLWGIALGLGLLSKYTMILIVPCQFAFLLLARDQRHWLFTKEPYLALLTGLIVFSPVLIWNWQYDWVSFAFQFGRGFAPTDKPVFIKLAEYLGGQAGIITPLLFLAFLYYSVKAFQDVMKRGAPEYLYLLLLSWPILLFFAFSSIRGGVAQPNWPAPAYIAGLLLLRLVYRRSYREKRSHRIFIFMWQSGWRFWPMWRSTFTSSNLIFRFRPRLIRPSSSTAGDSSDRPSTAPSRKIPIPPDTSFWPIGERLSRARCFTRRNLISGLIFPNPSAILS
jgi:4-amino-4-deoxy-L-arabinose transferase-like glycosyltransferase